MFAIQSPKNNSDSYTEDSSITPNILPYRIHHDGLVDISTRYWNPVVDESSPDTATVYFRGRKLRGRRVLIPEGYQGVLASQTDPLIKLANSEPRVKRKSDQGHAHGNFDQDKDDEEEDEDEDWESFTTILDNQGTFSEFMVWGHEKLPAADDPFVKGVREWIRFAEAIHATPSDTAQQNNEEGCREASNQNGKHSMTMSSAA